MVYNMNLTTNVEVNSVHGSNLPEKSNDEVMVIHIVNGTMVSLPTGVGTFFKNAVILALGNFTDASALKLKFIRRSSFVNFKKLEKLWLKSNDLEMIDSDAFQDLPNLTEFVLHSNASLVLHENIFEKNRRLDIVAIRDTFLEHLPGNIFKNKLFLTQVDIKNCSIRTIDENLFETNTRLGLVSLKSNKLEYLPKNLFENNLHLLFVDFSGNALKTIETDFYMLTKINYIFFESNACTNANYYESNYYEEYVRSSNESRGNLIFNMTEFEKRIKANCK